MDVCHGGGAADEGHGALVEIAKWLAGAAVEIAQDVAADGAALLDGDGRDSGKRLAVGGGGEGGEVAGDKYVLRARDAEIGLYLHVAGAIGGSPQHFAQAGSGHPRS